MSDVLGCCYADDTGARRRSAHDRQGVSPEERRFAGPRHLGIGPAIARDQGSRKGAQRGPAVRPESRRIETRSADRQRFAGPGMSIALLDVNVLVALFDPAHSNHDDAHRWFGRNRRHGWATCPTTINGFISVLRNFASETVRATPAEVAGRLRSLCATTDHHFW